MFSVLLSSNSNFPFEFRINSCAGFNSKILSKEVTPFSIILILILVCSVEVTDKVYGGRIPKLIVFWEILL